ncbi:hypothetical protein CW304_13615 [Bacillus sp. UFRGS-B20]|nr:hypothetical protein CW304_13615 [Bacillus sp. UFRGS-B20]
MCLFLISFSHVKKPPSCAEGVLFYSDGESYMVSVMQLFNEGASSLLLSCFSLLMYRHMLFAK